ncbi:MAG TPA: cutinase family protein [Mycobacterium sp.]|nr:cutinase family protein [Mycobacterium sp.]
MYRPPQCHCDHVVAAALFGAPESAFADTLCPGPLPTIGPLYATKTIDLCVPNDPICSDGSDMGAHVAYVQTGMVNQAATFRRGSYLVKIEKFSAFHRTGCKTPDSPSSS